MHKFPNLEQESQARQDSTNAAAYAARQLDYVMKQVYMTDFEDLKARAHFPMTTEPAGPGAETKTVRFYDAVGLAKIGGAYSDWPVGKVSQFEHTYKIKSIKRAYEYDFQTIFSSQYAGIDLPTMEAIAAKEDIMELEDEIAYLGNDAEGITGAFNHPNIPVRPMAYPLNSTATADNKIDALNDIINAPTNLSNGKYKVNMVLLDTDSYTHIATTPRSATTDTTILQFLKIAHPGVEFDMAPLCKGNGYNNADIVFAYNRNPLHIALGVEYDFTQRPPFDNGAVINVKCYERFSGVHVFRPLRCCKGEQPVS